MTLGPWPVLLTEGIDPDGTVALWTWEDACSAVMVPEYAANKLEAPGWLPVRMVEGQTRRAAANVAAVWALVVDLDEGVAPFVELIETVRGLGFVALLHTTWSHRIDAPKARAIFPLNEECPVARWREVWTAAQRWAASWGAKVDEACKDPGRLYFRRAVDTSSEDRRIITTEEGDAEVIEWAWDGDTPTRLPSLSWRWVVSTHSPPPPPKPKRRPEPCAGAGWDATDAEREDRRRSAYLRKCLATEAARLAETGQGGRNRAAFKAGVHAGRMVLTGLVSVDEARAAMMEAAAAAGLDASEAAKAIDNGMRRGQGDQAWTIPS